MIENILLGFLMYQDMTGYEIKSYIDLSTAHFYDASFGSIYPALKRLVKRKLVGVREENQGNKVRKVYTINEKGMQVFMEWLESPLVVKKGSANHLTHIFFYHFLDQEKVVGLIRDFLADIDKVIKGMQSLKGELTVEPDQFQWATYEYGMEYYQFLAGFYRKFLNKLTKTKKGEE